MKLKHENKDHLIILSKVRKNLDYYANYKNTTPIVIFWLDSNYIGRLLAIQKVDFGSVRRFLQNNL